MKKILPLLVCIPVFFIGCKKMDDSANWNTNPFDQNFDHRVIADLQPTWTLVNSGSQAFYIGHIVVTADMRDFAAGVGGSYHFCRLNYQNTNGSVNESFQLIDAYNSDFNTIDYTIGQVDEQQNIVFQYQIIDDGIVLYTQDIPLQVPPF